MKKDRNIPARVATLLRESLDQSTVDFLNSCLDYWHRQGYLTLGQSNALEKIESRFSPQEKEKFDVWKKEYLHTHKKDAIIISRYYMRAGYYVSTARKILNDDNYVPTEKQYRKMFKNKYAQKILKTTTDDPKFEVNELVQFRSTVSSGFNDKTVGHLKNRLAFVLDNDLQVVNAVQGGKRYRVLPMGSSEMVETDERNLMKPNKKGQNK
jgi:hypothetical protein